MIGPHPAMTQIEAIVEPDGKTDDVRWESIAFVCAHPQILTMMSGLTCQYQKKGS
ncbi:MAG: hypothetical protein ACI82A_004204 [Candidatus Azotimanducaceae bacterium]|jgi:hypothetical protein